MYKLMLKSFFQYDKNKRRYYLIFITTFAFLLISTFIYSYLNSKIDTIIESKNNRRIIINSTYDEANSRLFEDINTILTENEKNIEDIEYKVNTILEINGEEIEIASLPEENEYYFEKKEVLLIPNNFKLLQSKYKNIRIIRTNDEKIMVNNKLAKKIIESNLADY